MKSTLPYLVIGIMVATMLVAAIPGAQAQASITITTRTNIRSGPSTDYRVLGVVPSGTQFSLQGIDASGQWYYGGTSNGYQGWAYLSLPAALSAGLPINDASAPVLVGSNAPAAAPAEPAAQPDAPVSAAPLNLSGLQLGGQVRDFTEEGWMHHAGMTWVKRQVVYDNGGNAADQYAMIQDAHNRGFHILLSVKGHAGELASDPNYINNFAGYLGGLAAGGADAIEVWNEMNIDREWPQGRIDPNWYTQMLAASYNAIKGANGATMVISGAPAPTGAEGAFGLDRVWNDDRYMRGLAAAGAANYMDCIGVHYNEGIISPTLRSGDPRSDFFTRYFWGMVDTYYNTFGGSKPLCFTELGYLSAEGFGALPGGFAWAQNVTVAQQAQWLAEAVQLSATSGKVQMVIIWNVDFTGVWGDDPMSGYAIVRPGGDCPACWALAGG